MQLCTHLPSSEAKQSARRAAEICSSTFSGIWVRGLSKNHQDLETASDKRQKQTKGKAKLGKKKNRYTAEKNSKTKQNPNPIINILSDVKKQCTEGRIGNYKAGHAWGGGEGV